MAPLISLITVVLNDVSGLKATADSIISQRYQNFEWIIVDGFSSDGSWELAQELSSIPGVVIQQSRPTGIYGAMNLGADRSRAPWLWFINAGDLFLNKDVLEKVARIAEVNEMTSVIATPVVYLTSTNHYYSLSVPRVIETSLGNYASFHHQGCILNSIFFKEIGGFDETFRLAADGKLLDSIIKKSAPIISPYVSVGFEMGGATSKNFKKSLSEIIEYRKLAMTQNEMLVYRFKEFLRGILVQLIDKPIMKYFLHFYISRRELTVIKKANVAGLHLPTKGENHE
jgi:glycosyltransferase involved in cell wall biosynthesis